MPISFNSIPSNWKQPLFWIEVDPSMAGYPVQRQPALLIGTMNTTGSVAVADTPIPVPSLAEARRQFGYGSMLDAMCESFFRNNSSQELWAIPIAEAAGAEATLTITVATPPTQAGTLAFYVAGRRVQIGIAADDTVGEVATGIAEAINADLSMPVVATQAMTDDDEVLLTCKWKGVEGNDIDVRVNYGGALAAELMPVGLTITIPSNGKLTGGTGTVDLTDAITNMGDEVYDFTATGFTDSTNLLALFNEYGFSDTGRWGWLRQLYGTVFGSYRGAGPSRDQSYASALAYGPVNNYPTISLMAIEAGAPTPTWVWAAAYCARGARALLIDPARPLQTLAMSGCLPAWKHQRFTASMRSNLAGVGLATQAPNGDDVPAIMRESSTYQRNLYSQPDDAYELITTMHTLAKLFRNQKHAVTSKWPRHKLADNGTRYGAGQAIVTPNIIRAELIAQYRIDEFNGLVENAEAFKKNLIVERDANNPNRVNTLYPPDLINGLRMFAVLAQFRLQYNRGIETTQLTGV